MGMFFAYVATTALLAWWPWNLILIGLGGAYAAGLHSREVRRLLAACRRDTAIRRAQSVEELAVTSDDIRAFRELCQVGRSEQFGHMAHHVGIDLGATPRKRRHQRSDGRLLRIKFGTAPADTANPDATKTNIE